MALTNCTITSASVTVTSGQALGNTPSQVLVITPNTGFVVSAADFSDNTGSLVSGPIQSISLSNSGTAYADNNTVLVTVDLKDSGFTPTANVTATIDIDGEAKLAERLEFTIAGSLTNNVCGSTKVDSNYNASGAEGTTSLLFTKVVAVTNTSTQFLSSEPTVTLHSVGNYADKYIIEASNHVYTNGRLTSVTLKLFWIHPAENVSGHTVIINCPQVNIPTPNNLISQVEIDSTGLDAKGETRRLIINGTIGASYVITVTDGSDNDTYDFTTGLFTSASTNLTGVFDSSGTFFVDIQFPANSSGATYTVSVAGGSSPSTNTVQGGTGNNNPFTASIVQSTPVSLVISASGTGLANTLTNNSLSFDVNRYYLDDNGEPLQPKAFSASITRSGGGNVVIRRQPVFSNEVAFDTAGNNDFTNTLEASNNGSRFNIENLTATGSGTTTLTVSGNLFMILGGTSNVAPNFALDNFINQPPVASAITSAVSIQNNTATNINLTATDPNSDTLTYSIVSQGSKGTATVNSSTGVATYTPAGGLSSGADSFTFKVNDTFEDSNTAQVNVQIQGGGGGGSFAPSYLWTWNDTEDGSTALNIIGNSTYHGVPTISGFTNGATSFTFSYSSWDVSAASNTMPSYVNNLGDIALKYTLRNITDNVVVSGPTVMNMNQAGGASSVNNGVSAVVATTSTTIPVTGGLSSSKSYRLDLLIEYDNLLQ